MSGGQVRSLVHGGDPTLCTGRMIVPCKLCILRHPGGSLVVHLFSVVPGNGHTGQQINEFDAVIHMQEWPPRKWFLVGCSSHFPCNSLSTLRRFALRASDACLVCENPMFSASALDGRVHRHSPTAMHDVYTPPNKKQRTSTPSTGSISLWLGAFCGKRWMQLWRRCADAPSIVHPQSI